MSLNSLSTPLLGSLTLCVPPRLCPPTHTAPSYSSMSPVESFQRRRLCARLSSSRRKASFLCMVVALFIASLIVPRNIRNIRARRLAAVPAYPALPTLLKTPVKCPVKRIGLFFLLECRPRAAYAVGYAALLRRAVGVGIFEIIVLDVDFFAVGVPSLSGAA